MRIPKLIQNSVIYLIVTVLQKGIGFFMLPLYTAYLTPQDYGIQSVVTSVSSFLSLFITLGLDLSAQRFYFKYKAGPELVKKLYGTIALAILLNSLLMGTVFIVGHEFLLDPVIGDIPFYPFVLLGILYVIVTPSYLLYQGYLNTRQDGKAYGINALCYTLLYVAIVSVLLVKYNLGVLAVLLTQLIVACVFFIYVVIKFLSKLYLRWDKTTIKEGLKYSLPILPHGLANWSNSTIDKLLLNGIRTSADTGIYGLGQQYAGIMDLTGNSINQAYVPWFFQRYESGQISDIHKIANALFAAICLIAFTLSVFAKDVLGLMISNPAFYDVFSIIPLLVFATTFQVIYFFHVNVLYLNHTSRIFMITVATMALNVVLNLSLIPLFGIKGAAIACIATYFIKSVIGILFERKLNQVIRFNLRYLYLMAFGSFIAAKLVIDFTTDMAWWLSLGIRLLVLAGLVMVVLYSFRRELRVLLQQIISKK